MFVFKELDVVRLKEDNEKTGIKTTYRGVILDITMNHATIEFFDEKGNEIEDSYSPYYPLDELILIESAKCSDS